MDRLPESQKPDISVTFEDQRKLIVQKIVPIVKKSINKQTFPVVDGIIKHIIHERHRHQREVFLNKQRDDEWNDAEKRRKHANSRRNEVIKDRLFVFELFF